MTCPACGLVHAGQAPGSQDSLCPDCFERFISGWVPDAAEYIADADRLNGEDDTP